MEKQVQRRPKFDLMRLAAAAEEGSLYLGGKRARDILMAYLGEWVVCMEFACAVVLALRVTDFHVTKNLGGVPYDEYGVRLPSELLERFGLEVETWYVKLTVREGSLGDDIFCLSLHPLEEAMNCVGGRLVPMTRGTP